MSQDHFLHDDCPICRLERRREAEGRACEEIEGAAVRRLDPDDLEGLLGAWAAAAERGGTRIVGDPAFLARSGIGSSANPSLGRNAPCWCGSGRKFKRCHLR